MRVTHVTDDWADGGVERIEGFTRHGEWVLPAVAVVRIAVATPYQGDVDISNVASYWPEGEAGSEPSQLFAGVLDSPGCEEHG